jgi:hypothetical protein
MAQMVEEHRSLYRIKNMYKKDAKNCKECRDFWKKLEMDKEDHILELHTLIKHHLLGSGKKEMYYGKKGEKKAQLAKMKYYYSEKEKKIK